ncbi:hypothetical protein B0H19DRAFT_1245630 [Mycena capillaripes]|nr:hypothetical protein B0H19DRAFT_1245630 [Mycena capillaripes]
MSFGLVPVHPSTSHMHSHRSVPHSLERVQGVLVEFSAIHTPPALDSRPRAGCHRTQFHPAPPASLIRRGRKTDDSCPRLAPIQQLQTIAMRTKVLKGARRDVEPMSILIEGTRGGRKRTLLPPYSAPPPRAPSPARTLQHQPIQAPSPIAVVPPSSARRRQPANSTSRKTSRVAL